MEYMVTDTASHRHQQGKFISRDVCRWRLHYTFEGFVSYLGACHEAFIMFSFAHGSAKDPSASMN